MAYMHIDNLYKNQDILMFKECYALEKIHGTSAHISWKESKLTFFSGGVDYLNFINLFDKDELSAKFTVLGITDITIYGEAYGGKCQGMKDTYGKDLRFVAFEVKVANSWLSVPDAEKIVFSLGLDFVPYCRTPTDLDSLDGLRDSFSRQSIKCGIEGPKKREGIVLRPLIELRKNNGARIIAKHKAEDFSETKTKRSVKQQNFKVLQQANEIAEEWVTEMRLTHVLDKFPNAGIEQTGEIINAMIEDVEREADGEIVKSQSARKSISRRTALMFKDRLKMGLRNAS